MTTLLNTTAHSNNTGGDLSHIYWKKKAADTNKCCGEDSDNDNYYSEQENGDNDEDADDKDKTDDTVVDGTN